MSDSSPFAASGGQVAHANGVDATAARPSGIQLVFREKGALYTAYIP